MAEKLSRREFLTKLLRWGAAGTVAAGSGTLAVAAGNRNNRYWQIDPAKCTQCGKCETACVKTPSAVKCVHAYAVCGYCDLCSGYITSGGKLNTGAENQLCPASAITRSFIEDPYYEYIINEELCIGCSRCVKGCAAFGNGSLFLQIKQDLCFHCTRCSIAAQCPGEAIQRVSSDHPYIIKGVQDES